MMVDNVTNFPAPPGKKPWHIPFSEPDQVIIEGRFIPKLGARDEGDEVCIILDGRFAINGPKELGSTVAWLVANALAIGEGYSHLGAETKERPFAPIGTQIGEQPQ
jgi:hypothetical protein